MKASAQANAPVVDKIGTIFVRVMPDTAPNASQEFMRIVAPSGKVGFVSAEAINPLGSDQICYGKDATGAWKIVGMMVAESAGSFPAGWQHRPAVSFPYVPQ